MIWAVEYANILKVGGGEMIKRISCRVVRSAALRKCDYGYRNARTSDEHLGTGGVTSSDFQIRGNSRRVTYRDQRGVEAALTDSTGAGQVLDIYV